MSAVKKPIDARTTPSLCALKRDNVEWGNYWMLISEGDLTLAEQAPGEPAKSMTTLPRHVFDRFIRWYTTGDNNMRRGR